MLNESRMASRAAGSRIGHAVRPRRETATEALELLGRPRGRASATAVDRGSADPCGGTDGLDARHRLPRQDPGRRGPASPPPNRRSRGSNSARTRDVRRRRGDPQWRTSHPRCVPSLTVHGPGRGQACRIAHETALRSRESADAWTEAFASQFGDPASSGWPSAAPPVANLVVVHAAWTRTTHTNRPVPTPQPDARSHRFYRSIRAVSRLARVSHRPRGRPPPGTQSAPEASLRPNWVSCTAY